MEKVDFNTPEWQEYFKGKSPEEIEEIKKSSRKKDKEIALRRNWTTGSIIFLVLVLFFSWNYQRTKDDRILQKITEILQKYNATHCYGEGKRAFGKFSGVSLTMKNICNLLNVGVGEVPKIKPGETERAKAIVSKMEGAIKDVERLFKNLSPVPEIKISEKKKYLALGYITEEVVDTNLSEEERKAKVFVDNWNDILEYLKLTLPLYEKYFQGVVIKIGYLEADLYAFAKGISSCKYKIVESEKLSIYEIKESRIEERKLEIEEIKSEPKKQTQSVWSSPQPSRREIDEVADAFRRELGLE